MRDVISKLKGRLRHGLATQELLDRLARSGFVVYPYIVFKEFADSRFSRPPELPTLTTRRLHEEDAAQISAISVRPQDAEKIGERFRHGNIGVGAFDGDKLIAYTWCNLNHFGGIGQKSPRRSLADDEAYLYDAFTLPAYRGHALVPHLRTELYKILETEGRIHVYSVSLWFNRSARRFKAKLGASAVEARLSVNLFDRFKRDLLLKRYEASRSPDYS
jgi:hypothetical protein